MGHFNRVKVAEVHSSLKFDLTMNIINKLMSIVDKHENMHVHVKYLV